jgi:CubicO group peptidase (beta-lactamase class C family)
MNRPDRRSLVQTAAAAPFGLIPSLARSASPPPDIQPLIEAERETIVRTMARERLEGVAVCLVHAGRPVWVEGFGVTDAPAGRKAAADTIFSLQSTSKNITATAIMIAVQRGLLDLDKPIGAYVPEFTVQSRFEPAPPAKITLRLLLSHRAGFTHEAPVGNNYEPAFPDFEAHVRSISRTWLRYPVGERYRYSNLGFDLAGYILQVRCATPFAEWVRTAVFEPLGMADSTFATDVYAARANRAVGHDTGHVSVPLRTPLIPSGGAYVSARDMAAYAQFHLGRGTVRGKVILQEALWNEMHGFGLGGDYGFGVIRQELRYGDTPLRLLSHKGGGFGFGSVFQYCPTAGLAWAAFFNRPVDAAYGFGEALVDGALAQRYGAQRPRWPAVDLEPIEIPEDRLQRLVGRYVGRNVIATIGLSNGVLTLQNEQVISPIQFMAPEEAFTVGPHGDVVPYQYARSAPAEPAHLECWVGEQSLDYNDGPNDAAGPGDARWDAFLGRYCVYRWGAPEIQVLIERRNGYLYLNQTRLVVETEPSLFFTSDGEAVDFRSETPTWKNLRLQRLDSKP